MDLEEEEEEEEQHFSGQDLMKIRDAIALLVQSLLRLLQTFPLKDRTQSASNCTQVNPPMLHLSSRTFCPLRLVAVAGTSLLLLYRSSVNCCPSSLSWGS